MKKLKSLIIAAVAIASINVSTGQAVEQGNVIIDGYYGFPNLYKSVFKAAYANSGEEVALKIGGLGPLGGRVEYMLADKIGLGLDFGFSNTFITYDEISSEYNNTTGEYDEVTYEYDFRTSKFGAMVTFNFHFLSNADKLDAYAIAGVGYGNRSFDFTSTNPDYVAESLSGLIPVAARIGAGMRYFFTDNIGLNIALGFGQGGLLNGGLTVKF